MDFRCTRKTSTVTIHRGEGTIFPPCQCEVRLKRLRRSQSCINVWVYVLTIFWILVWITAEVSAGQL